MSKVYDRNKAIDTPSGTWQRYALLPVATILSVLLLYISIVWAITGFFNNMSVNQEEYLWSLVKGEITSDDLDMREAVVQARIQHIVDKMPKSLKSDKYDNFEVVLVKDMNANAFAAPGGRIILTTGLLSALKTENGLVFVIGHELGHFIKQDHLQEFARVAVAGLFSTTSPNGSEVIFELLMAISNNESQEKEYMADKWGLKMLMQYYGHAGGVLDFFEVLGHSEDLSESLGVFSTHPPTQKRTEALAAQISTQKLPVKRPRSISRFILK